MRPKKAIQHASGVENAIREIARKQGMLPADYLEQRWQVVRNEFGTPKMALRS
jgi:hypothetical protein